MLIFQDKIFPFEIIIILFQELHTFEFKLSIIKRILTAHDSRKRIKLPGRVEDKHIHVKNIHAPADI